jgi:hypothetical protein
MLRNLPEHHALSNPVISLPPYIFPSGMEMFDYQQRSISDGAEISTI